MLKRHRLLIVSLLIGISVASLRAYARGRATVPMNVAQITSLQSYRAHYEEAMFDAGGETDHIKEDVTYVAPDNLGETSTDVLYRTRVPSDTIFYGHQMWWRVGIEGAWQVFPGAALEQSLIDQQFLHGFSNVKGRSVSYHGVAALEFTGAPSRGTDLRSMLQFLPVSFDIDDSYVNSTSDLTIKVHTFDLVVRRSDQAPLEVRLDVTITSQGKQQRAAVIEKFSDLNGTDIPITPPPVTS